MEDENVKRLAATLIKQGLAVSMYEALEKAKSILNVKSTVGHPEGGIKEDRKSEEPISSGEEKIEESNMLDQSATLNELMKEAGVSAESEGTQVSDENLSGIEEKGEGADKSGQKEGELISNTNVELKEASEEKAGESNEEPKQNSEDDGEAKFQNEKKVDLTKVFGYKV
jgi:hypothetical protein